MSKKWSVTRPRTLKVVESDMNLDKNYKVTSKSHKNCRIDVEIFIED